MKIPETVFRYRPPTKYAFAELATCSLWMSNVEDFNDPLEFQFKVGEFLDTPENREFAASLIKKELSEAGHAPEYVAEIDQAIKSQDWTEMIESAIGSGEYLKNLLRSSGVCCFSGVNDSYLMWGHYAQNHTGFVVEYRTDSFPLSQIIPVTYSERLYEADYKRMVSASPDFFDEIMTHKGKTWRYEKEYRLIHKARKSRVSLAIESTAIKAIYFGTKCSKADRKIIGRLVADLDVGFWQAELLPDRYGMQFRGLEYEPHRPSYKELK